MGNAWRTAIYGVTTTNPEVCVNSLMRSVPIAACLTMVSSCGRSTDVPAKTAPVPAASSVEGATADELGDLVKDVEVFVGGAQMASPSREAPSPWKVADRILAGFEQAPPNSLQLDDGSVIYWGRQEGQAALKSIAVYDSDGQLRLVGAVNNLPILYSWRSDRAVANKQEYRALLDKMASWGSSPSIMLFVNDSQSLQA